MDRFARKQWLIGIAAVIVVILAAAGAYWYWTTTPQYALYEIKKAYATHDSNLALKFIDTDSVFDNLWAQVQTRLDAQMAKSDGFAALGTMIGEGIVERMKPTLKEDVRNRIIDSVKTATSTINIGGIAGKYTITRDGPDVLVEGDSPLKIRLEKNGTSYWRVVAIEGIDLDPDATDNPDEESP
jgi:hypothetical protein